VKTGLQRRLVDLGVEMSELEMRRRVTANVWFWQGLRWAPGGLVFLLAAALSFLPADRTLLVWLGWTGVLALWWYLYRLADRYYARRFGVVIGLPGLHRRRDLIKWFVAYPLMSASVFVDLLAAPRIFFSGMVWAAALLAYRASTGGGRWHYLVGAAVLAALTTLPEVGVLDNGRPMVVLWAVVVGVLYLALGTLDHLELTRRFPLRGEP
jgi:hypothetical protein